MTTGNSVVLLFYALAGNYLTSANVVLPTNGGCTLGQLVTKNQQVAVATANCITRAPGPSQQASSAPTPPTSTPTPRNMITAIVFPPYQVFLTDNPATGNMITNGTQQVNGNMIQVIGSNTLVPAPYGTNTFIAWQVDSANAANVIIAPMTGTTTNSVTVMGQALITAFYSSYSTGIFAATISNQIADQGQKELLSISSFNGILPTPTTSWRPTRIPGTRSSTA